MTIANITDPSTLNGATVHSNDGEKLGKIDAIYYDNETDRPAWAAVKSGLFGGHVSLVPLQRGTWDGNALTVPYDKEAIKAAPHHDPDTAISVSQEQDLYRHYGVDYAQPRATSGNGDRGGPGHDTSGPNTDDAMTRSEERMHVGTETREAGRARLRKHVVTENVSTTVPVSHEEVRIEREPITDANRDKAMAGPELTEEVHEVTLHEERAVTSTETVPVERVRLGTETVTEQETVTGQIRKEQIEADGVETGRHGRKDR